MTCSTETLSSFSLNRWHTQTSKRSRICIHDHYYFLLTMNPLSRALGEGSCALQGLDTINRHRELNRNRLKQQQTAAAVIQTEKSREPRCLTNLSYSPRVSKISHEDLSSRHLSLKKTTRGSRRWLHTRDFACERCCPPVVIACLKHRNFKQTAKKEMNIISRDNGQSETTTTTASFSGPSCETLKYRPGDSQRSSKILNSSSPASFGIILRAPIDC